MAKGKGKGKKGQMQVLAPGKDEEGFNLVDNRQLPNKTMSRGKGPGKGKHKGIQANYQEGILGQNKKQVPLPVKGKGKGKGKGPQRRGIPSFKEWSVQTKTEWPLKREFQLWELGKVQVDAKQVEVKDLMWCGELPSYNKDYDRMTTRNEKTMRRFEDLNFFNVTTSDDPILTDFCQSEPDVSVIATDHVLACLVAAARSIYSWDLVITKLSGKVIIDKRDFSQVDFLSVNETAMEPPSNEDKDNINSAVKLSNESSCINQNFSQMVLDSKAKVESMDNPNPFEEEGEGSAASGAYRYRKFTIPGNSKSSSDFAKEPLQMIVRTEVNCKMPGGDSENPQ